MGSASKAADLLARARAAWARFWHVPLRAERLALMRILLGAALLTDLLFQYLPHFAEFFGPGGVAPAGRHDAYQLRHWRWTVLFFNTDNLAVLYPVFAAWVAATAALTAGWHTRLMNVAVWFLTMCFINRNPNILNGGDDTLQVGLFLLMLSPSGRALSLDARRLRKRGRLPPGPAFTPAWPVRVIQIQLCLIYLSTGLVKLKGDGPFSGTWWDGTSIHYVLNYVTMSRWSFAQLPLPFWLTAALTYVSVWWEVLFPLLVLSRYTRRWALWFGVLFHLGIWLSVEVGWFSFYTLAFYGVWVPCAFWQKWRAPRGS
jgi:uncharacterized membrane protein YphA (DoxX/SURF4 family)